METMYKGIPFSPQVALSDSIGAGDTIVPVTDVSAFPDAPNLATIGTDEDGETILYAAKTASSLSGCVRGVEGSAKAWPSGTTIARNFTNKDLSTLQANIDEANRLAGECKESVDAILTAEPYSASATYKVGNVVTHNGSTWRAKRVSTGQSPAENDYWTCIAKRGDTGETGADGVSPSVTVTSISGGHRISITDANGTKTFDVMNGTDGNDGEAGASGADGIGIQSVEQTTTSSADGGSNVITVTKTDGSKSTFIVKNGSKGSQGATGPNAVSTSTTTSMNGILKGNGSNVAVAVAGTDYATPANLNTKVNRTTAVNAADTNYTTLMARGEKLLPKADFDAVTDWSQHLVNGAIVWGYE